MIILILLALILLFLFIKLMFAAFVTLFVTLPIILLLVFWHFHSQKKIEIVQPVVSPEPSVRKIIRVKRKV